MVKPSLCFVTQPIVNKTFQLTSTVTNLGSPNVAASIVFSVIRFMKNDKRDVMKLSELQSHIKEFDYAPEKSEHYFLKFIEEVGELSESIRKGKRGQPTLEELKGSIAEELYDVLYYVCALANIHDVDLEKTHELKEVLNKIKYNR